jgi:RNA polymerase sigma-70 factor (ECF subfamily)
MPERVLMAEPTAGTRESDADVITRSETDPEAFAVIFERHFDEIHRYLRRRFPEQAEEIAADVFVAAFDARARYRPYGDSARPWLYGIASHLLSKRRRCEVRSLRAHARSARAQAFDETDVGGAVHRLDAARQSAVLAAALATLAAADRDVLLMYALAELSYDEIAVALDVPTGTVRSRLARARRLCAPMLGELDD